MTTASTQLRALEGEIAEINAQPLPVSTNRKNTKRKAAVCDVLLTIAKEMEKRNSDLDECVRYYSAQVYDIGQTGNKAIMEIHSLRTENATLKRRLDEAMTALSNIADGNSEFTRAYAATVIDRINNHMP